MLREATVRYIEKHCPVRLDGKTVIVTGANSGIGFKATEELISLGARVIMACRSVAKANQAKDSLLKEYPLAQLKVMEMDLADSKSIQAFVNAIISEKEDVFALVNNAGVYHLRGETADGWPLIMGTNYIGTYLLTEGLIPYFKTLPHEVRISNTSSLSHKFYHIDFEDFFNKKNYRDFAVYGRSKLCVTGWTLALAKELKDTNIKVYMTHPGIAITPIAAKAYGEWAMRAGIAIGIFNTPEKSAVAIPQILTNDYPLGTLLGPRGLIGGWGYPHVNRTLKRSIRTSEKIIPFTQNLLSR